MGINVHVLDAVSSGLPAATGALRVGSTPATLGASALVAAVAGKKIRVLGLVAITTLANSVKLQSAATDITGLFPLAANGTLSLPFNEHGWCETVAGEALNINLSVATSTGVQVVYTLI